MPIQNREIADIFERLADLLEIEEANNFRVRAYRNAARTVRDATPMMAELLDQGEDLSELPGIGDDLAGKIATIVETGSLPLLEDVESRTPRTLSSLMDIEGLGPKRTATLNRELDIESIDDLEAAARDGKVRELSGFGRKTEEKLLAGIERMRGKDHGRTPIREAEQLVGPLVEYLERNEGVKDLVVAGSYRRRKATVGDLDILVTAKRGADIMDDFAGYEDVEEVVSRGDTRSTVRLRAGISVDLRVVPEVSYGAALHYFTGSKAHNIAVRKRGVKRGYKINEYGVFEDDERIAGRSEEEVYEAVDLPYITPELRENRGEIDAAESGELPQLVTLDDIRGDLHSHTDYTDGHHTLREMAEAAAEHGYSYLGITDHTRHVTVARGLDEKRLRKQIEAIDRLNEELDGIRLLKGSEVDILEDGALDLPDSVLSELDFTVCSVHYKFDLSRKRQTNRIVKAMENPNFRILGHPTGRLINEREAYEVDLERIMEAAAEHDCVLELNANPKRLDLTDQAAKMARERGVRVAISTDSHKTGDLDFMRFGIDQARRGWLEVDDVINTRPLDKLLKLLRRD
jgi:DNA polymerase (family 10)